MADWLRDLKPGDKVLVQLGPDLHEMRAGPLVGGRRCILDQWNVLWDTVDATTGLGDARVTGQARLVETTPDRRAKWHRQRLLAQLDTVRWEDLPTERLEAVWALVTGV